MAAVSDSRCSYEHELPGETWSCPHAADEGFEKCPFHRPVAQTDDERVTELFLERARAPGRRSKEFIGASFGDLQLAHTEIDSEDNYPIVLKDATFEGAVTWSFAVIRQPLRLQRAEFATDTTVTDVDFEEIFQKDDTHVERDDSLSAPNYFDDGFEGGAAFPEVSFEGGVDFRGTTFAGSILASSAEFYGVADFWGTEFKQGATFEGSIFKNGVLFDGATFHRVIDLSETTIEGGAVFERARAEREFSMSKADILDDCIFAHMNFSSDASFESSFFGGDLNLEGSTFEGRSHSINFRSVEIAGELNWAFSTIRQPLHMQQAAIATETNCDVGDFDEIFSEDDDLGDEYEGGSPFPEVGFDGGADFRGTTFDKTVIFQDVDFEGVADLWGTRFHQGVSFEDSTFECGILLDGANCQDTVDFSDCSISHGCVMERLECHGTFSMAGADIHGKCVITSATFGSEVSFNDADFHQGVEFSHTEFQDAAHFKEMQCLRWARFRHTTFAERVQMHPVLNDADVMTIDLSHSTLRDGELGQAKNGEVIYDLSEATVGTVRLLDECDEHPVFQHFIFENTTFDGFAFDNFREDLADSGWNIHETIASASPPESDADFDKLETTYLMAKNGAMDIGETKAAAEFFIREMSFRRKGYWKRASSGTESLKDRAISSGRWIANTALMLTSGYGERPWRVIGTAIGIIGFFAILFAVLLPENPYDTPIGYIVLSSESFITLVLGGAPSITNEYVRLAADFEGFLGAFLMALFVFTLTRSVAR